MRQEPEGPLEVSRQDLQHLSLAAAAVVAHDQRGPIVVGTGSDTTGELLLAGGQPPGFWLSVTNERPDSRTPLPDEPDAPDDTVSPSRSGLRPPSTSCSMPS